MPTLKTLALRLLLLVVVVVAVVVVVLLATAHGHGRGRGAGVQLVGARALAAGPGLAAYFAGFSPADVSARAPASSTAAEYLANVADAAAAAPVLRTLQADVDAATRAMPARVAGASARLPWRIAVLHDAAEQGFPHTHGTVVCLPMRHFAADAAQRVQTLVHERVHVLQRAFPGLAHAWARERGYRHVGPARELLPPEVLRRRRSNPDLDGELWAGRDGLVPVQVFTSDAPRSLAESRVVLLDPARGFEPHRSARGGAAPPEHPWEHMAYELAGQALGA